MKCDSCIMIIHDDSWWFMMSHDDYRGLLVSPSVPLLSGFSLFSLKQEVIQRLFIGHLNAADASREYRFAGMLCIWGLNIMGFDWLICIMSSCIPMYYCYLNYSKTLHRESKRDIKCKQDFLEWKQAFQSRTHDGRKWTGSRISIGPSWKMVKRLISTTSHDHHVVR